MYTYTLAFIKRNDEVLLLNRNRSPWKGSWNGVGGKIESHETPLQSIQREIKEETGLDIGLDHIQYKGYLTWNSFDANGQGLYLFLAEVESSTIFSTPRITDEGILEWKKISWATAEDNFGIADNIPYFLPIMLNAKENYHFHCIFDDRHLLSVEKEIIHD